MPYRTILINTLSTWAQSKVVILQGVLLFIMSVDFFEAVKLYAVLIGAAYTTIKFYKDFVHEKGYWDAFKNLSVDMLKKAGIDVRDQKREQDKKEGES